MRERWRDVRVWMPAPSSACVCDCVGTDANQPFESALAVALALPTFHLHLCFAVYCLAVYVFGLAFFLVPLFPSAQPTFGQSVEPCRTMACTIPWQWQGNLRGQGVSARLALALCVHPFLFFAACFLGTNHKPCLPPALV